MREILFKGYSKETQQWYYGMLGKFDGKFFIDDGTGTQVFVDEKSIGQYTGKDDKCCQRIYEGDIVEYISDTLDNKDYSLFKVGFWEEHTGWHIFNLKEEDLGYWLDDYIAGESKVVGNAYEVLGRSENA